MLCAHSYPAIIFMTMNATKKPNQTNKKTKTKWSSVVGDLQFNPCVNPLTDALSSFPSPVCGSLKCLIPNVLFLTGMSITEHICKLLEVLCYQQSSLMGSQWALCRDLLNSWGNYIITGVSEVNNKFIYISRQGHRMWILWYFGA